jgi:hypothetical protein
MTILIESPIIFSLLNSYSLEVLHILQTKVGERKQP